MIARLAVFITLAMLICSPISAQAEVRLVNCLKADGTIFAKSKCIRGETRLTKATLARALGISSPSLAGTWRYYTQKSDGTLTGPRDITLTQSGNSFRGSNDYHTMTGITDGRYVTFTLTVSGEEIEGWVLRAEGSIIGDSYNKLAAFYEDSQGNRGSVTALKQ